MGINIVREQLPRALEYIGEQLATGELAEGRLAKLVPQAAIATFNVFGSNPDQSQFTGLAVNSCGSGLFILLKYYQSLGYENVIIQSNTMYCVKTIVNLAGLAPIVLASDPDTLILGVDALADDIRENGSGKTVVLVSHIGGGFHESMSILKDLAESNGMPFIEDMAHALGNGVAPIGDAGVFSMYATKSIPAGEGGIIVTTSPAIQEFAERFVVYDRHQMQFEEGLNLRVPEFQAAFMLAGIELADQTVNSRMSSHEAIKGVLEEFGVDHLPDQGISNGYKLIITDSQFLNNQKLVDIFTQISCSGTVFGYSLADEIDPIPHYCFDTNFGHSADHIQSVCAKLAEALEEHFIVHTTPDVGADDLV